MRTASSAGTAVFRPSRAIILGAGQGSRLLPLTENLPKCLLDLSGRSMLGWQLQGFAANGIREVVIVTGFRAEVVDAALPAITPPGLTVRTLFNPFYKLADNLASCWMTRGEIEGGCLLVNGDTLFEPAICARLLDAPPAPITVTIDRKAGGYDADDMKVETVDDRLLAIGKKLPADRVNGESIGFLRFSPEGAARFIAEIDRTMRTPDGPSLWYLSAIHRLANGGADVRTCSIEGLEWGELDYPADLDNVRAIAAGWMVKAGAH